jgi:hypothetical protein
MNEYDSQHGNLPEDVTEMAVALDALARQERGGAPGLEERLFARTRSVLIASDEEAPRLRLAGDKGSRDVRGPDNGFRLLTPLRLAAAVAVCSGVAAMWLATLQPVGMSGPVAARPADDLDPMLALAWRDDGWSSFRERIDLLTVETEAMADSLVWEWVVVLPEGSM